MNRTCYLVAHVDGTVSPPVIRHLGMYSEGAGSVTCGQWREFPIDLHQETGDDYEDAHQRMVAELRHERCQITAGKPGLKALVDELLGGR